jgi:hypothetical protein
LFDANDGTRSGDIGIHVGFLLGDTTGNGAVTASDIGETKAQSGQAASASNFRMDVTPNGAITTSDLGLVKSQAGALLPGPTAQPLDGI